MRCIVIDKDKKTRTVLEQFVKQTTAFHLMKSCARVEEAMDILVSKEVDVVFLDISMSGMDEIEFMKSVNHNSTQLIVIANSRKYAKEAFDFDITDYLMRPITWERFLKAISKAQRLFGATHIKNGHDEMLFIKEGSRLVKILLSDILYFQSVGDYVSIKTAEKKYVVHETLKNMADKLPDAMFLRVHQSYIVNLIKIIAIEDGAISIDSRFVPIGRSFKKELMNRLKFL